MKRFPQMTAALAKSLGYSAEQFLAAFAPATAADVDAVVRFREKNLSIPITWNDASYLRWRYAFAENDSGSNANNKLWILKLDDRILGILGAQHMPISMGEHEFAAVHPLDILVDATLGGVGLGAWMQFALDRQHEGMVLLGATKTAATMVQRSFHSMPDRQVWKLLLDLAPVLRRHIKFTPLAICLAVVLNPFVAMINRHRLAPYRNTDIRVEALASFPAAVEKLDASQRGNFFYRHRTAAFLNWKFVENPNVDFQRLGFYKGDALLGYVVFRTEKSAFGHKSSALIQDFFWLEDADATGNPHLPETVLAATIQHLRQSGATYLVQITASGARAQQAVKRLGFFFRDEKLLFSLSCNAAQLEPSIYDPGKWFLTEADAHDAIS